jgi:hypothetical protein
MDRRELLRLSIATAALPWTARAGEADEVAARLKAGRSVIALRHTLAPGTFDPPGFRVGDCRTQRNLDDAGRAHAQRIGRWFGRHGLTPSSVRSSPWCRCLDTAHLAFGRAEPWPALGSPRVGTETTNRAALDELRQALTTVATRPGRFEVWVTHQFVLSAFVGGSTASGEGLLLQAGSDGTPQLLGRLRVE